MVAYTSRSKQFFGQVGGADFALEVAGVEAGLDARPPAVGEPFVGAEELAADPVERVSLAASMAEGVLLDAAAALVEAGVGEPHGVEVVDDQLGVRVGWPPGRGRSRRRDPR